MHFFAKLVIALPAVAGVASAAVIPRDVDSDTMIAQLQDLTTRSQAIDAKAQTATPVNGFQVFPVRLLCDKSSLIHELTITPTQDVANDLRDLITATSGDATAAANTQPFADEATQQSVCDAFDTVSYRIIAVILTIAHNSYSS